MGTPILILGFNRPEKLRRTLSTAIELGEDRKIYVAIDGPRVGKVEDTAKVQRCQDLVENCKTSRSEIISNFSAVNRGCKDGVINAITWLFENEQEGIILEDDCMPSEHFFPYCDELLDKYRHEYQIWMVAGDNSADIRFRHEYSYSFAPEPLIWGWATWRDRWARYDGEMNDWNRIKKESFAERIFRDREQYVTRSAVYDQVANGELDTWDYQLSATIRINRGLCIVPRHNLVSNIGFGEDATHTTETSSTRNAHPTREIMPLYHPPCIFLDREVEQQIIEKIQGVRYMKAWRKAAKRARNFLVEVLKALR